MSGRIFQNAVLQIKETTDRVVGVIDGEGCAAALYRLLTGRDAPDAENAKEVAACPQP